MKIILTLFVSNIHEKSFPQTFTSCKGCNSSSTSKGEHLYQEPYVGDYATSTKFMNSWSQYVQFCQ